MSTLEVVCGRCDKRFRVRSEFAGKKSRCPGCSAPIAIGGPTTSAGPRREAPTERSRPRRRDAEDDDTPRPTDNWKPVNTALGREQGAVLFVLVAFVSSFVVWGIGAVIDRRGPPDAILLVIMLLLLITPLFAAGVLGIMARVAALRAPPENLSKGAAVSSLLCGIAGVGSLAVLGLAALSSIDSHGPEPLVVPIAVGGIIFSGLGALVTFVVFVTQVGIARKSDEISRAFGRTAVAICACVLSLMGIAFLVAVASALSTPSYSRGGPFGYHEPDEQVYMRAIVVFLVPLSFAVILILYHRLLAAGRQAVQAEAAGRYDG